MDRKAGYKECTRCGLRNKPSALQCDFCGLRFTTGEDWDENLKALEKMRGTEEKVLIDEDVSRRIESTIVRREKIVTTTKVVEPEKNEVDYFKKEPEPKTKVTTPIVEQSTIVIKETVVGPGPEPRPTAAPILVQETTVSEKIVIQERSPAIETEPTREKRTVRRVVTKTAFSTKKSSVRRTAFIATLVIGVVLYFVALGIGPGGMGRTGGWMLITISALMVVAGAGELFIGRTKKSIPFTENTPPTSPSHQDVLICPKCHELVTMTDKICPDCGSEFQNE
jgi:hypothetical protein